MATFTYIKETNQSIECSNQHEKDVIEYLERSYGSDYKAGKNCLCQILDVKNSKYIISEDDVTKSEIEFVYPTYNSPETKHVQRSGYISIIQYSSAKTFEKEHFSVSVKFVEDDAEMMQHTNHIISLIQDVCSKNDVTIKIFLALVSFISIIPYYKYNNKLSSHFQAFQNKKKIFLYRKA